MRRQGKDKREGMREAAAEMERKREEWGKGKGWEGRGETIQSLFIYLRISQQLKNSRSGETAEISSRRQLREAWASGG